MSFSFTLNITKVRTRQILDEDHVYIQAKSKSVSTVDTSRNFWEHPVTTKVISKVPILTDRERERDRDRVGTINVYSSLNRYNIIMRLCITDINGWSM